jgi:hypothetical protein
LGVLLLDGVVGLIPDARGQDNDTDGEQASPDNDVHVIPG